MCTGLFEYYSGITLESLNEARCGAQDGIR